VAGVIFSSAPGARFGTERGKARSTGIFWIISGEIIVGAIIANAGGEQGPQAAVPTVLVVEDETPLRTAVAEMLRDCGLRVIEAANADEAMALLRTGACADLVFTDIEMPGAMDGLEFGRRLRVEFPALKLIVTSGGTRRPDAASNAPFIAKPYGFADVERHLKAALIDEHSVAELGQYD
jgi:CheY-like chemotaxis protein